MSWSWLELLRIAVLPHNERSRAKLLLFKVDAFTKLRCWSISDLLLGNYWGKLYNCSTFFLALFIACWINSVYDDPLSLSKRAFFSTTTLPFRSYLTSSQILEGCWSTYTCPIKNRILFTNVRVRLSSLRFCWNSCCLFTSKRFSVEQWGN